MSDTHETEEEPGGQAGRRRKRRQPRPAGLLSERPMVAVVGRPNVGKSTLFNRLAGARIAVVEDVPGVTRDRHYADAEALGKSYTLADTGGFDPDSDDPMQSSITEQVKLALEEVDVVLCVLDGSQAPLAADREAVQLLRQAAKPVLFVANKCDSPRKSHEAMELYSLGIDTLFMVSALHGHGVGDLEEALADQIPEPKLVDPVDHQDAPRIAIVGRPNAGKSSLTNKLLGEERQIVDDRPGTTVDSIDAIIEHGGEHYVLIDTAGIRRKRAKKQSVEALGVLKAIRAMERSDVVVLMIDAAAGPAEQDAKIAGLAADRGRALIVALNKIDLLDKKAQVQATERARDILAFVPWARLVRISAHTGRGIKTLLSEVELCVENHRKRVTTSEVNRFFEEVLAHHPPPPHGGRPVRLYYVTQAQTAPPSFVAVANEPDYIHFSYKRYVANQLRERFAFDGTPLRVFYRRKKSTKGGR